MSHLPDLVATPISSPSLTRSAHFFSAHISVASGLRSPSSTTVRSPLMLTGLALSNYNLASLLQMLVSSYEISEDKSSACPIFEIPNCQSKVTPLLLLLVATTNGDVGQWMHLENPFLIASV